MKGFTYHEPNSIGDAVNLLNDNGARASLIAGGTDLVIKMKQGKSEPEHVISLQSIPGINEIKYSGEELRIGSMVTHRAIEQSKIIRDKFSLLADAVDNLGSVQVRNLATIGGNICNGAPSADTVGPLMALDAVLLFEGPEGERSIPITEFFHGPGKTAQAANEILKEIVIHDLPPGSCSRYIKYTRRKAMDLPLLGIALVLVSDGAEDVCKEARIGLTLAAPTPIRATKTEEYVAGKPLRSSAMWDEAGNIAVNESSPRTSFRTTSAYRKKIIQALLPRAAFEAIRRLSEQQRKG